MSDPVISAQNLSKAYRIWARPADRLTSPLLEAAAKVLPGSLGLPAGPSPSSHSLRVLAPAGRIRSIEGWASEAPPPAA